MNTWVALLRGVNVNGINIKMPALKGCLADIGLAEPKTILASGNVVFNAENTTTKNARADLKSTIEGALRKQFGYDAWIVLITAAELKKAIDGFPYDASDPTIQPYVLFGSDQAALGTLLASADDLDPDVEEIASGPGVIYWRCPKGRSTETPFAKLAAKPKFRSSTTTRNMRTLQKVLAAAG